MNRYIYLVTAAVLLMLNASTVYAENSKPISLPLIETTVTAVSVIKGEPAIISIPQSALITRDGIPGVFVLENNEARFRMVRPGKISANNIEILSGLFGGEILITGELNVVRDGSPVKIIK